MDAEERFHQKRLGYIKYTPEVEEYMDMWLTKKIVASTVSSRMMRQQGQSENQTISSLECARVNIGEERDHMEGKGGGIQRLRYIDGDVPRCMRHNDDKSKSTAAQPHTREKEKGSSNEEEEKEIEEGGSKEVKRTEAKHEKESKDPISNSAGKKGKHCEKRTKKKMSPSLCYKRM